LTLAPALSVEANIVLGLESSALGWLRRRENFRRAGSALERLQRADIDLKTPVGRLSIGEQQLVEIARALATDARIIVMDEPTSTLSEQDRDHLFAAIRN
jgi:ribose transport system ATP-binding protein